MSRTRLFIVSAFGSISLLLCTLVLVGAPLGAMAAPAPAPSAECVLDVPPHPLTAAGLATPYLLSGTGCHEAAAATAAFAEATILDPATGALSTYKPLVIDKGTAPAVAPVVPSLPANAVVGIGIGFNGDSLSLADVNGSLADGHCVNGTKGSIFGQVSFCNDEEFYDAANKSVARGLLKVPDRGIAKDGIVCPSTWSYSVIDMDPIDNTDSIYLVTAGGKIAQDNAANRAAFPSATLQRNPGDYLFVDQFTDPVLGCKPWMVRDLTDPAAGALAPSHGTSELQARFTRDQNNDGVHRVALAPLGDEMSFVNGQTDLHKLNLLRMNVDQPIGTENQASTATYCRGMLDIGLPRIKHNESLLSKGPSLDPAAATNLFTFTAQRFSVTWVFMNCESQANAANPITLTTNQAGVVTDAKIDLYPGAPGTAAPRPAVIQPAIHN